MPTTGLLLLGPMLREWQTTLNKLVVLLPEADLTISAVWGVLLRHYSVVPSQLVTPLVARLC